MWCQTHVKKDGQIGNTDLRYHLSRLNQNPQHISCKVDLPSIFRDNTVDLSLPDYFENKELPIICYKYNKPIRSTIFNLNKLVADLDIDTKTPDSLDCKNQNSVMNQ